MVAKFLVNKLGIDVGVVFAVIAVIAIIYGGYVSLTKTTGIAGVTASQLLNIANASFQLSSEGMKLAAQNVVKTMEQVGNMLDKRMQDLKEKIDQLGLTDVSTPYYLMADVPNSVDIRLGEMPADYVDRTKAGVDMSLMVSSLPSNYVDMAINLPTFQNFLHDLNKEYEYGIA